MCRVKLYNFEDNNKLSEFIDHLENQQDVTFIYYPENQTIVLDFPWVATSKIFYASAIDYLKNNVILAIGPDCQGTNELQECEHIDLENKMLVSGKM
jgi:kynurenine formamidase